MNKELIKKYKTEFDYWLNGGKLLGRFNFTNVKNYKPEPWFEFEETKWSLTSFEYLSIIIEDEYVEFRKALAEGKTIQVNNLFDESWTDIKDVKFTGNVKMYRIKPEEPQFKVGAWVRDIITNKIHQVKNEDTCNGKYSQVIKWNPQPGEWCWVSTNGTYSLYQYNSTSRSTHDLEPFIGTLPTHLKD